MANSSLPQKMRVVKRAMHDDSGTAEMYAVYCQGKSLSQVAKLFGMTRQSVFGRFKYHGLEMRKQKKLCAVVFNGNKYTKTINGYMRRTDGDRELLHRDMWKFYRGPIPDGWDVHHKDEDKSNNTIENFECIPKPDHTRHHNPRRPVPLKKCAQCGKLLTRHESKHGQTETPSAFKKRLFCDSQCSGRWRRGKKKSEIVRGIA